MSLMGLVSRVTPVHTAMRNCMRDEGGPFEIGNQVLISSHRKLLWSKAMVVSIAETAGQDPVRQRLREASASEPLMTCRNRMTRRRRRPVCSGGGKTCRLRGGLLRRSALRVDHLGAG
jgi:hypothetical protein